MEFSKFTQEEITVNYLGPQPNLMGLIVAGYLRSMIYERYRFDDS